jgi:hypothetical protein
MFGGRLNMIAGARFLGLAATCAALLVASAWVDPARAQSEVCKPDVVTADGRAKFRPFTRTKELEGRGSAMADAVATWQQEVGAKFGEQWKMWSKAKDTTFNCAPSKPGKIIGGSFIGCTISGRPCSFTAPTGGRAEVGEEGRDRGRQRGEVEGRKEEFRDREIAHQRYRERERMRDDEREASEWIPPRPRGCGRYRYWNGEYCADARYDLPFVGPSR